MDRLTGAIKTISANAVGAGKPVEVVYGTVTSVNPLTIFVDEKLSLTENFLQLTNAVKNHAVDVHVEFITGKIHEKDGLLADHDHSVGGIKKMMVKNGLKKGEAVIMMRCQGGQKYIVIDRVSEARTEGEWEE